VHNRAQLRVGWSTMPNQAAARMALALSSLWFAPLGALGMVAACSPAATPSPAVPSAAESNCSLQEQGQVAVAQGDCRTLSVCGDLGLCSRVAERCEAASDHDCERSRVCRCLGACSARQGMCVARSDLSCRRSHLCRQSGRCTAAGGQCIATSDAECEASAGCKDWGACVRRRGGCWPR